MPSRFPQELLSAVAAAYVAGNWDEFFALVRPDPRVILYARDNEYQATCLSWAAYFGKLEVFEFLVQQALKQDNQGRVRDDLSPTVDVSEFIFFY